MAWLLSNQTFSDPVMHTVIYDNVTDLGRTVNLCNLSHYAKSDVMSFNILYRRSPTDRQLIQKQTS